MSTRVQDALTRLRGELRHEPIEKRIRAIIGGHVVVDTTRALLVWEPRRIVPMYAVPERDVRAEVGPAATVEPGGPALLHPGIPFAVHSTAGEAMSLTAAGQRREAAVFRPADPDLTGYLVLDFDAIDEWYEEDEPVRGHARDPFHRVDVRASSRHVRIEDSGRVLADTTRPVLVFETNLPTRFYVPREDITATLRPSDFVTYCPYKGEASYWSTDGRRNIVWSYQRPLPDATQLAGLMAFFDDLLDVTVDGVRRKPADTVLAKTMLEEFGV